MSWFEVLGFFGISIRRQIIGILETPFRAQGSAPQPTSPVSNPEPQTPIQSPKPKPNTGV